MKRLLISFVFISIFFSLYVFFFYSHALEFAIIPKWAIPFSAIASFLRKAPRFFIALLIFSGTSAFVYTIYLLTEIIHNKTKNWWKTGYFSFAIAVTIIYAFIYSLNFYFYPQTIPTNNLVLGLLILSTILLSPLKEFKKYIIPYIIFLIAYFTILEIYGITLLVDKNIALVFYPAYIILLYLLVYHLLMNEKLDLYLVALLILVPIKYEQRKKYMWHKTETETAEYTMIIPSSNYYSSSTSKQSVTPDLSCKIILELNTISSLKEAQYNPYGYSSLLENLNLNKERLNRVKELLKNKDLYIGKTRKERMEEIIKRWEGKKEIGIISLIVTGKIPDRVGLLKYTGKTFGEYHGTLITNVVDALPPEASGITIFKNVPPGKYELILLYTKKVPNYNVKIPIIESNNDTVNLGNIRIR